MTASLRLSTTEFNEKYGAVLSDAIRTKANYGMYLLRYILYRYARDRAPDTLPALYRLWKVPGLPLFVGRKIAIVHHGWDKEAEATFTRACTELEKTIIASAVGRLQ